MSQGCNSARGTVVAHHQAVHGALNTEQDFFLIQNMMETIYKDKRMNHNYECKTLYNWMRLVTYDYQRGFCCSYI